jgi:plasmid replication initiation protein
MRGVDILSKSEKAEMILNKSRSLVMTRYVADNTDDELIIDSKKKNDVLKSRMFNHILYIAQKMKNTGLYTCKITREEICENVIRNNNLRKREEVEQLLKELQHTSLVYWDKKDNKDIKISYNLLVGYKYILQDDTWEIAVPEEIYKHLMEYLTDKKEKQQIEEKLKGQRGNMTEDEIKKLEEQLEEKRKNYAPIDLYIMNTFMSSYTVKLYEVLRLWSRTNKEIIHKFSLEEIRYVLGLEENQYERYSNLKQRILNGCIKELEEKANMTVKITEIKTGRRTTHISVSIYDKENKIYFREKKLLELRTMCMNVLDEIKREVLENEISDLSLNSQSIKQSEFEETLIILKKKIKNEIDKAKGLEKFFDSSVFEKFKIEYKNLDLDDKDIMLSVIESVSKTFANTECPKGKIYAKNYSYFKTVFNKLYSKPVEPKVIEVEDEESDTIPNENDKIEKLKVLLQTKLESIQYKTWIAPLLENAYIENSILIMVYEKEFTAEVLKEIYSEIIEDALNQCEISAYELNKAN